MDTARVPRAANPSAAAAAVSHLPQLTGLRWLAALMVILHHFGPYESWPTQPWQGFVATIAAHIALSGFVGVDLFFVLSGFILTYCYLDARGNLRSTKSSFWIARVARIYPVYLLATIAAAPGYLAQQPAPAHPLLTGLFVTTVTQAWIPWMASVWNPPGWSLSVEALFYVVFPFIAPFCASIPLRRIPLLCAACWVLCLAIPFAYVVNPGADIAWIWVVVYNPILRLPEFLLGMLVGRAFVLTVAQGKDASRFRVPRGTAEVCLFACIVILARSSQATVPFLRNGGLDPLFALLIYALATQRGPLSALLSSRSLSRLGEASYGMYVLHWPLWGALTALAHLTTAQGRSSWPFVLDYLGVVTMVSLGVFMAVERPARTWLRNRAARPRYRISALGNAPIGDR